MNAVIPHLHEFEGQTLATFTWRGRPCWVARHIGARVGYAQAGKRLPNLILKNWSDEFIEGHDYALLAGDDLVAFQTAAAVLGAPTKLLGQGTLLVLFESGLHLVLAKTEQPIGRRLRRFLVDEVLPQIARTGAYEPDADEDDVDLEAAGDDDNDDDGGDVDDASQTGAPPIQLVLFLVPPPSAAPTLAWRREARMARQVEVRDRWIDLCDRRLRVATLHRAIDRLRDDALLSVADASALELLAVRFAVSTLPSVLVSRPPPGHSWPTSRRAASSPGCGWRGGLGFWAGHR
jgi:prophage antirepressor-like protein